MSGVVLLTLPEIAERLRIDGKDRLRSVRRTFQRHGVNMIKRDGHTHMATDQQFAELLEKMTCSPSASAEPSSTSVVRSASATRPASSKSTLQDAIAGMRRKRTRPD